MRLLFDRLSQTMERALDHRLERGNMIAGNLANVDTPDFTPVDLRFNDELQALLDGGGPTGLRQTHGGHRGRPEGMTEGEVEFDYHALPNADGNSVDLDHEMAKLTENQLLYRATTRAFSKRMALLKYAIAEGQ